MTRKIILIVSTDTLGAALLGGAVELAGSEPHYLRPDETPRVALRRTRPTAVLIDCGHPDACAASFIGPALMTGARVILFRTRGSDVVVPQSVTALELPTLELPQDADRLSIVLAG